MLLSGLDTGQFLSRCFLKGSGQAERGLGSLGLEDRRKCFLSLSLDLNPVVTAWFPVERQESHGVKGRA